MSNKVRPSWTSVYKNYPQIAIHQEVPTVEIFKQLFGSKYNTTTQLLTITERNSAGKTITKNISLDNACATRVSIALTLAGHDIKAIPKVVSIDFNANQEATFKSVTQPSLTMKGKSIITTAKKLKVWLEATYGASDVTLEKAKGNLNYDNLSTKLRRKRGIYLMIAENEKAFGATGHATLWIGSELGCVMGGKEKLYLDHAKSVHFWELYG